MSSEIFKIVFSKIQKKELDVENQITVKFFELEMNQSNACSKQVVNKDQNQSIFTHLCY